MQVKPNDLTDRAALRQAWRERATNTLATHSGRRKRLASHGMLGFNLNKVI
jgi:hypothetical protein